MKNKNTKFFILYLLLFNFFLNSFAATLASKGMVVSASPAASKIGAEILQAQGNAIDAAVAVGYALAVSNPCCGNLGGGGFMLIHLANGKNTVINFREKAPLRATEKMFFNEKGRLDSVKANKGYLAVAVPGTVLGLETALKKYGTMTQARIIAPAIKLAQEGYVVSPYDEKQFSQFLSDFRKQENVAAIFLKNNNIYPVGSRIVQNDLAKTLEQIALHGSDYFYKGPIAQAIVSASEKNGGILTLADFSNYQVEELTPLTCHYRNYEIISAPPPSSGGVTLCEILNILEYFPLAKLGFRSFKSSQYIIEAMRYAYLDRNNKLGDPNFVKNPIQQLLSKEYAREISEKIRNGSIRGFEKSSFHESNETTHYSVIDQQGNAVSVTYTLNGPFGAEVIADQTGFFLNDEMDDFAIAPLKPNKFGLVQSHKNAIAPGKRPLSSMAPTIVMKDGKVILVIGSPGGPRIITSVLLALINLIDYKMSLEEAILLPRFHYQNAPDVVYSEPFAFPFFTRHFLELKGYHFADENLWGAVAAILVNPNYYEGVYDKRRDGAAIGI